MPRLSTLACYGLAGLLLVSSFSPAIAAGRRHQQPEFATPHGMTLVHGQPRHALQLRGEGQLHPKFLRQVVRFRTSDRAGTIVVDTRRHFLYLVLGDDRAIRYGIGVAKDGFEWSGRHNITNKRQWPSWTPPAEMLKRRPELPRFMEGGPDNPLGARALYIGSTLYRIHGTNEPWSIGQNVSSGCIRMTNEDVTDLYTRVKIGAKVVVL